VVRNNLEKGLEHVTILQFFNLCVGGMGLGTQRHISVGVIIKLLSFGVGGISVGGPSESFESKSFVVPCRCIVRIEPDGLLVSRDGIIILSLVIESNAFVPPGLGSVEICAPQPGFSCQIQWF
jgi:hypothetical protein